MLAGIIKGGRVASAYLFVGPPGPEKLAAAQQFADGLQTKSVDRLIIEPDGATLKIAQILELQTLTRYGPTSSPRLVAIIKSADEMTPEAAGAFLKTLEEPSPGVIFVLLVEREERLPETIISRCQKIVFGEPAVVWQRKPELAGWYKDLQQIGQLKLVELFELSARLEKEKDQLEELLYDLAYFSWHELREWRRAKIILETIKDIKKRANLRLTLDVACLRMQTA
ncbi:hypothetical protein A2311_04700 [candidate division WOR-1 bacterium RIFOXYB2_FULL_48_7]|uniref:DNA polymerase III subunit delta n=1 Tax=candidate division WOR-1 bacterium RIFOXYB2_FULL_48_7 TaxID=1802583 RepID=A0A1F4TS49_UNCSA|nr:MAG: hypothetical protein A2311_04700 [candidate division WOR-1 bacterium RIFOXYB2_FULL_48_7]